MPTFPGPAYPADYSQFVSSAGNPFDISGNPADIPVFVADYNAIFDPSIPAGEQWHQGWTDPMNQLWFYSQQSVWRSNVQANGGFIGQYIERIKQCCIRVRNDLAAIPLNYGNAVLSNALTRWANWVKANWPVWTGRYVNYVLASIKIVREPNAVGWQWDNIGVMSNPSKNWPAGYHYPDKVEDRRHIMLLSMLEAQKDLELAAAEAAA
jgi:hypothetical protein